MWLLGEPGSPTLPFKGILAILAFLVIKTTHIKGQTQKGCHLISFTKSLCSVDRTVYIARSLSLGGGSY